MSKWAVQLVIGKLTTDEDFRHRFQQRARDCLVVLRERGVDLNDTEIAALLETDPRVWSRIAARIDRRLCTTRVSSAAPDQHGQKPLTRREQHVLRGVFEGLTNKEIAAEIGVSEGTVKATLQRLFQKTHVRTRSQLVRIAIEGSVAGTQKGV